MKNEALTLQFKGKVLVEEALHVRMFGSDVINITDMPCVISQRHQFACMGNICRQVTYKGTEVTFCGKQMSLKNTYPYPCPFHLLSHVDTCLEFP